MEVVLERHNETLTNTWESPRRVLDLIDRPNMSLNYQVVYPAPVTELRENSAADYRELLGRAAHAHMQNYQELPNGELKRCFLDEGIVDYSALGEAARSAGYAGAFMVEFLPDDTHGLSDVEALRRDLQFIRSRLQIR
ncbi:MAG: hypothetical protein HN368_22420, partial [Spirochaetales bacterium]|nr:hypothetical protein [Spirochaetales bacterium]